jgi:hypothetical protein
VARETRIGPTTIRRDARRRADGTADGALPALLERQARSLR